MGGYKYNGTGTTMTPQQAQDHLAKVRAQIRDTGDNELPQSAPREWHREMAEDLADAPTSALATSSAARAAAVKPPRIIPGEVVQGQPVIRELRQPPAEPALKGAVKVAEWPARSIYPFRQIADDGGIWKLEAAAYVWRGKPIKVSGLRSTAAKWAMENGLKAKTVVDGGFLYVQFTKAAS